MKPLAGDIPPPGSASEVNAFRMEFAAAPPRGGHPAIFLDKLGERLAFERAGVRLYELLLVKYDAFGSWPGGPTREDLVQNRADEFDHYLLLEKTIVELGADPTMVTPAADVIDVASNGFRQVHGDPRTTLLQALEVQLIAELADDACWVTLIALAKPIDPSMADNFEAALMAEERHVLSVREWIAAGLGLDPQDVVHRPIAAGRLTEHPVHRRTRYGS